MKPPKQSAQRDLTLSIVIVVLDVERPMLVHPRAARSIPANPGRSALRAARNRTSWAAARETAFACRRRRPTRPPLSPDGAPPTCRDRALRSAQGKCGYARRCSRHASASETTAQHHPVVRHIACAIHDGSSSTSSLQGRCAGLALSRR